MSYTEPAAAMVGGPNTAPNILQTSLAAQPESIRQLVNRLFEPTDDTVPVIHPSYKSLGRISVPWPVLSHTNGLDRVLQHHPHAPSLCVLYQNGRCNSRERCNQIHVDRQWASMVWYALQVAAVSNCCQRCGDLPSAHHQVFKALAGCNIVLRIPGIDPVNVPVNCLAATHFWHRFLQEQRRGLYFSPDRVCMLHQQNTCKYGVECKNVHLCRRFWHKIILTAGAYLDKCWESVLDVPLPPMPGSPMPQGDKRRNGALEGFGGPEGPVPPGARHEAAPQVQVQRPRERQALAIVHPASGEELSFVNHQGQQAQQPPRPAAPPTGQPLLPNFPTAPSEFCPVLTGSFDHLKASLGADSVEPTADVGTIFDSLFSNMPFEDSAIVSVNLDPSKSAQGQPPRRVPTIEAMSELDAVEDSLSRARRWTSSNLTRSEDEADAESARSPVSTSASGRLAAPSEQASTKSPRSPSSSVGSESGISSLATSFAATASFATNPALSFSSIIGRSFPKPSKTKANDSFSGNRAAPGAWPGAEKDGQPSWAQKSEANRGKYKTANLKGLGVAVTQGPDSEGFGFGAGRGRASA